MNHNRLHYYCNGGKLKKKHKKAECVQTDMNNELFLLGMRNCKN